MTAKTNAALSCAQTNPFESAVSSTKNPRLSVIQTADELRIAIPAWQAMIQAGAEGASVHNDPNLILARLDSTAGMNLRILQILHEDKILAIAPFYLLTRRESLAFSIWRLPLWRATALRMFGDSAIVAKGYDPDRLLAAMHTAVRSLSRECDFIFARVPDLYYQQWSKLLSAVLPGLSDVCANRRIGSDVNHSILLEAGYEDYLAKLGKKTRKTLRQSYNRIFSSQNGTVRVFTEPNQVPELLSLMGEVYADAWQARAFRDLADTGNSRRSYLEAIARQGWLRSYVLLIDDEAVAFEHGYSYRGVYYSMEAAFRQDRRHLSPGTVLGLWQIEDLHRLPGLRSVDLGIGDMPYKQTVGNISQTLHVLHVPRSLRSRAMRQLQILLDGIYKAARTLLVRIGKDSGARRLIKKQSA